MARTNKTLQLIVRNIKQSKQVRKPTKPQRTYRTVCTKVYKQQQQEQLYYWPYPVCVDTSLLYFFVDHDV